jgi:hypothetical protein
MATLTPAKNLEYSAGGTTMIKDFTKIPLGIKGGHKHDPREYSLATVTPVGAVDFDSYSEEVDNTKKTK